MKNRSYITKSWLDFYILNNYKKNIQNKILSICNITKTLQWKIFMQVAKDSLIKINKVLKIHLKIVANNL